MSIVSNIQSMCNLKGVSVPKVEKDLGFGKGSIYKWDKNSPSIDKLQKVAEYFNVTVDSLITDPTTIRVDLTQVPGDLKREVLEMLLKEPSMTEILKKISTMPPEKRESIINLIKTM